MRLWIPAVLLLLVVGVCESADDTTDSLKSALYAVTRRQRDLADDDGDFMMKAYHYLSEPKQFVHAGAGQPEDIGYGFQKSGFNTGGKFHLPSNIHDAIEAEIHDENFDKALISYLENIENDDIRYNKNSPFRELEKKSVFREQQKNEDIEGRKFDDSTLRKLKHHDTEQSLDPYEDNEYFNILQSMWQKYKKEIPSNVDSNVMTEEDVSHILKRLRPHGALRIDGRDVRKPELSKHFMEENLHGSNNEFLGNPKDTVDMNNRNHHRKRNDKDRDFDETQSKLSYYWKYGPPTFIREYVGQFGEEGENAFSNGNYDDDVNFSNKHGGHEREQWFPVANEYSQKEETFPEYNPQMEKHRKRSDNNHEVPLSTYAFLQPAYSPFSYRKRFPVTKRSPRLYSSPPLLHHEKLTSSDNNEVNKESSNNGIITIDPKVVKELNQIFSPDENLKSFTTNKNLHDNHSNDNGTKRKPTGTDDTEHVGTPSNNETHETIKHVTKTKNKFQNENHMEDDSFTSQQDDGPIEIKKKSIDLSDYFGIDRRRKKLQPEHIHESQNSVDNSDIADKWMQDNYDSIAANFIPEERENSNVIGVYGYGPKRDETLIPHFETSNLAMRPLPRNSDKPSLSKKNENYYDNRIKTIKYDKMDRKLQNIEDLIVNQAVKYTGAHEDANDSREIQNVKNNVISQLAAAYSLEKIRTALEEFKSILAAQRNSKNLPENQVNPDIEINKNKHVDNKEDKAKITSDKKSLFNTKSTEAGLENSVVELLEDPLTLSQLSEGYMGSKLSGDRGDCTGVNKVLNKCFIFDESSNDQKRTFSPFCCLRQLCYACSPQLGERPTRCDALLMEACGYDASCLEATDQCGTAPAGPGQCSCIAHYFLTD